MNKSIPLKNTNLVRLLLKFKDEEIKDLNKLIRSPFFNIRKDVVKYFDELRKFYPDFDREDFTKEKIYSRMFPGKQYDDAFIRRMNSFLMQLVLNYLVQKGLTRNRYTHRNFLISELIAHGEMKLACREIEEEEVLLGEDLSADYNIFKVKAELENLKLDLRLGDRDDSISRVETYARLPEYWVCHAFIYLLTGLSNITVTEFDFGVKIESLPLTGFLKYFDIEGFLSYLESNNYRYYYLLAMNYYGHKIQIGPQKQEHFVKLKGLLERYKSQVSEGAKWDAYVYLLVFCDKQLQEGCSEYIYEKFNLCRQLEEDGLVIQAGIPYIDILTFYDCFFSAADTKNFQWARYFFDKYAHRLHTELRENISNYCMAYLNTEQGIYDTALRYLAKTKFKTFQDNYKVKILSLKIFYETGEYEQAYAALDAAKHLSKNKSNTIFPMTNMWFKNFISCYERLLKVKEFENYSKLPELEKTIKETNTGIYRRWLMDKIRELQPKNKESAKSQWYSN